MMQLDLVNHFALQLQYNYSQIQPTIIAIKCAQQDILEIIVLDIVL